MTHKCKTALIWNRWLTAVMCSLVGFIGTSETHSFRLQASNPSAANDLPFDKWKFEV